MFRITPVVLFALVALAHGRDKIDVAGKVAVVTGASRGIGEASAKELAAAGIKVVVSARSLGKLEAVVEAIKAEGGEAFAVKCDVSKGADVKQLFEAAAAKYGGVDFVFANAGFEGRQADLTELSDEEIAEILSVNVVGYQYTLKYALPHLRASDAASIAFTSSVAAIIPRHILEANGMGKRILTYMTSKAPNDYLARAAHAYFDEGIRSFGILPGVFATKMVTEIAQQNGVEEDQLAGFNPVYGFGTKFGPSIGDPRHIGRVLLAMFDNSTFYEPGTSVVCDNDVTIAADVFYRNMHHVHTPETASGGFAFPLEADTIRDFRGDVYVPKKEEL